MTINKKQIIGILQQEIDWHNNNRDKVNMPDDWIEGFIAGLKHNKKLFNNWKLKDEVPTFKH